MDTDEWEFVSDDGFPDSSEGHERRQLIGKRNSEPKSASVKSDHDAGSHAFLKNDIDAKMNSAKGEAMEIIGEKEGTDWEEQNSRGFDGWKLSLTGVGAICSFGVAAATICFLFFRSNKKRHKHQIYSDDDKGIKQKQVAPHTTKFNESISAMTG